MEIHIIRHTAVHNPENLCYGISDISLRRNHKEDFQKVSIDGDYDGVISSPAIRCQALAQYFSLDYRVDERLIEMNFGDWEMKKWSEIPEDQIRPWYHDFVRTRATNGENLLDMQKRVLYAWKEIISGKDGQKILMITHAGVIRLILQSVLGFPLENMFSISIDYGKKCIFTISGEITSVKHLNV